MGTVRYSNTQWPQFSLGRGIETRTHTRWEIAKFPTWQLMGPQEWLHLWPHGSLDPNGRLIGNYVISQQACILDIVLTTINDHVTSQIIPEMQEKQCCHPSMNYAAVIWHGGCSDGWFRYVTPDMLCGSYFTAHWIAVPFDQPAGQLCSGSAHPNSSMPSRIS